MKRSHVWLAIGLMQTLVACGSAADSAPTAMPTTAQSGRALAGSLPPFTACDSLKTQIPAPTTDRKPHHGVQDVLAIPGTPANMHAWFDYNLPVEPLSDGTVGVQMDMCNAWQDMGPITTNEAGYVDIVIPPANVLLGSHRMVQTVQEDNTTAESFVYGLPAGTHMVVFDIDGTLTINNAQFEDEYALEMFEAGYTPKAFAGAAALTREWASKGYVTVYLTGRPHSTMDITRSWLDQENFAAGPVHVTETLEEALPFNEGVGDYKTAFLQSLVALGYTVDYAYGNEPTDVYAYENIGMPLNHVFTIGSKAGTDGSTAIHTNYLAHLLYVATQPNASQPFSN